MASVSSRSAESLVIEMLVVIITLVTAPRLPVQAPTASVRISNEMLIKLTVDPMPASKPALRYLLLPDLAETHQGNPIPNYLKCLLDQDFSVQQDSLSKAALKQADRAARMDKPDWQILPKLKTDGVELLLPDLQRMRHLASELQRRFRDEIAIRRFDDALYTARTMFALSRHMGEHPTIIGEFVAIAIAFVAITPLEEMLEQPGCPNLYWALTNLPAPLITLDKGMEGERLLIAVELRDLDDQKPMTAAQLKKLIARIDLLRSFENGNKEKTIEWLSKHAKDEQYLATARQRLIESGIPKDRIEQFSTYQVLLLDEKLEYVIQRDEMMKLLRLPTWEAIARLSKLQKSKDRPLIHLFLDGLDRGRFAQGRLEQKIAMLRHVEAFRMYAAAHSGNLPAKLADVDVPLPVDPFTGKPFRYELKDGVAHLRGSPPPGQEEVTFYNLHYEISIRK